jgi:hypothetical protein
MAIANLIRRPILLILLFMFIGLLMEFKLIYPKNVLLGLDGISWKTIRFDQIDDSSLAI